MINPIRHSFKQSNLRKVITIPKNEFHGVKLKLTYEKSGKSFDLPWDFSPEMKLAKKLNEIIKKRINNFQQPQRLFHKASAEDFARLTSETLEDSYKRVAWTNPKDGKIYHILEESRKSDKAIAVKILDEEGAFVKNAIIEPKKIVIMDNFENDTQLFGFSHGEFVETFAKRNNPFASFERVQRSGSFPNPIDTENVNKLLQETENGSVPDYLSCSFGGVVNTVAKNIIHSDNEGIFPQLIFDRVAKKGTRVLFAAGNDGPLCSNNALNITKKVEGVGALSPLNGEISAFSSSVDSSFTQHYEIGEYYLKPTPNGINITGLPGTDIAFFPELELNPFIDKSVSEINGLREKLRRAESRILEKKPKLFSSKAPIQQRIDANRELDKKLEIIRNRSNKIEYFLAKLQVTNGKYIPKTSQIEGTSFSTPVRTAKLALNDMLEGIL